MKRILFLDDNPARRKWAAKNFVPDAVVFAETAEQAIECLERAEREGAFDEVYLDHDLGDEVYVDSSRKDCGMEVVRWVVENKPAIGRVIVHTMNTPAGHAMARTLKLAGYDTKYRSFYRMVHGQEAWPPRAG